ncbi:hypothetical protein GZ77_21445 [Endozoicomonas montiporae]|uniref:Cytosolic endo-beta-N-acetylglucosaminidase TIM barrel domain-containing protein n=2 Tax=Endozoicomonas montiporae TaxID=1027273 RepID=A0A081N3G6_9GAMM|nr:hypothetical protein [Endozoicomonas montiporae]AMO58296.1 endo-beta-N-acetylglucosaminidase [Endozoicomonas montiporae CL-33]KEQ12989.1 hypothetical protein GZ77_21445 [Endozoicomonas montiporae]
MNTRQRIASVRVYLLLTLLYLKASANSLMPVSPAWQIDDLMQWQPDDSYWLEDHRSSVPLQKLPERLGSKTMIFHSQATSGQTSQGVPYNQFSVFTNWHLADVFIYWAGSLHEGIIVPPPVYWVEQGHKEGVPVYGVVNLQPQQYGGRYANLEKLLTRNEEDGSFPVADQLIDIAQTLGFDGWFINQETEGGMREDATGMAEFLRYFMERAPKTVDLIWYDAMKVDGQIEHQGALNQSNHQFFRALNPTDRYGRMVIDYRWNEQSLRLHQANEGLLFYGIDAHQQALDTYRFQALQSSHRNLALFASNWHFNKHAAMEENHKKAEDYWHGENEGNWPGICSFIEAKPVIRKVPFITGFNRGQGDAYYHKGRPLGILNTSGTGWTQPQQQTPLPDGCDKKNSLTMPMVEHVTHDGYEGSGAVRIKPHSILAGQAHLFSADYRFDGQEELILTYRHNHDSLKPAIELKLVSGLKTKLELPRCDNSWCTVSASLNNLAGQVLQTVTIKMPATFAPSNLDVGQLKIINEAALITIPPRVWVTQQQTEETGQQIRLNWDKDSNADHYLLFTLDRNGEPDTFIGQTRHTTWVVEIPNNAKVHQLGVLPVSREGDYGVMGVLAL